MIALAHLPALDAKTHLETSRSALYGEEQALTSAHDTTGVKRSKRRVWIGGNCFSFNK